MLSGIIGVDVRCSCHCSTLAGTESACLQPRSGSTLSDAVSVTGNIPGFWRF